MRYSVAIPIDLHNIATNHLIRNDGQEDLCFALWVPSTGVKRKTALIDEIILPDEGDRSIHGNASFYPKYFERALAIARSKNAGLAFIHSHLGPGWQDMSSNDIKAELLHAGSTMGATGLPLVGLTLGTDESWSARFWNKIGPNKYEKFWCESVRVIGDDLKVTFANHLLPVPKFRKELTRTVSAWGNNKQADLARMRIGIVGTGSVGTLIAESLARMGIGEIKLIDFDLIEDINLDRTLHAKKKDAQENKPKVYMLADALRESATAEHFEAFPIQYSIVEEIGFKEALDCDILFSCVDRPWARHVLNFIAYVHLIPVIDGGITVRVTKQKKLRGADWKAHVVTPSKRCMQCLKQYDPGLVSAERDGMLDDPTYIESLPNEHPVKRNENVFAFSLATASLQVLQMLSLIISPLGISNVGEQNYHFVTGDLDIKKYIPCEKSCIFPTLVGQGDQCKFIVTGKHAKAEEARNNTGSKSNKSTFSENLAKLFHFKK